MSSKAENTNMNSCYIFLSNLFDQGQRESCHGRCVQERRNDSVLRCILRDYDGRYDQTSAHKNRRWVEEPIYQQKEPRHSSEHRNYNSAFFHRGENSHNFEKDSTR